MHINKTQWLIALALSGALLSACHQQATKPAIPAANLAAAAAINNAVIHKSPNDDRSYAALLLPNQLQVVLVSDPTLEASSASMGVGVGSAQDPESQPGLAHYLEHMLFLGTKKYPEPDNFMGFVDSNGGMTNAFTAYDKTNYLFTINAGKFDEALDRYSDYFKSPILDPLYADKERNAVNAEWSKNRDQDGWMLHYLDGLTANPQNPRSHFSIGNLETLSDKKDSKLQDELKAFYNRYYSANNMRLTLVGKQSIPELKALAEKYFADVPNKNIQIPKVTTPGLTQAQMGKIIRYHSVQNMKELVVQFPIKNNKADWRLKPNELVATILGSEEEGALSEQLHKAGWINHLEAGAQPDAFGPDGYFMFDIELTEQGLQNRDKVIAAIFAYVDLVKKQGIDETYFRELQAVKAKDFLNVGKPNPLQQAIALTTSQFDIPVENILDADYLYDHFDAQAVNNVLQQLDTNNVRIAYIGQNETGDKAIPHSDGKYAIADISADDKANWEQLGKQFSFNLPPKNDLFTDKPADLVPSVYLKPHQVVSQKGVEIYLQHPEFYREDKGVLDIELNVPFAKQSAKNLVLANLLSDIYKTKNTVLIDRAERASLRVNAAVSATGSQFINIGGYTTKHEELLQKMLSGFAQLQVSDKEFGRALDSYKENLENNKKAQLYKQAIGHIRRMQSSTSWTDAELLQAANKVTLKDVVAYHKAVKTNVLTRIFAFGNYSEDTIKHFAQVVDRELPGSRMPAQRSLQSFITPAIGKNMQFTDKVAMPDSALLDAYIADKKSADERAQVTVLNAIYGNEFFKQLRTNEQLGYAVFSFPANMDEYAGFAMLVQSANLDLVGLKARMDKFRTEFAAQLNALDPAQIEQIKMAEAANITQKPTDFYKEAKRYDGDFWMGRFNFDSRDRYLAALAKVDKASLIALYQRLLLDGKNMHVLIQLQGTAFKDKPFAAMNPPALVKH